MLFYFLRVFVVISVVSSSVAIPLSQPPFYSRISRFPWSFLYHCLFSLVMPLVFLLPFLGDASLVVPLSLSRHSLGLHFLFFFGYSSVFLPLCFVFFLLPLLLLFTWPLLGYLSVVIPLLVSLFLGSSVSLLWPLLCLPSFKFRTLSVAFFS